MVKREEYLKRLASWTDEGALVTTSLSSNAALWSALRPHGANFYGWNMGLCVPFALGLSLAFPKRQVIALDSDGSLLADTGALVTVADASPPNLTILVMDNQAYANMGTTATARLADLEKIARGAGIKKSGTVRTLDDFVTLVKPALDSVGPSFFVVKVQPEKDRIPCDQRRTYSRAMKEAFLDKLLKFPDYGANRGTMEERSR